MDVAELTPLQKVFLGIMIGDTLGAQYEFYLGGPKAIAKDFEFVYRDHPGQASFKKDKIHDFVTTPAGIFTDDTQMSLGVAEYMLSHNITQPFDKIELGKSFIDVYKRDPIAGYSSKTSQALNESQNGHELIEFFEKKKWKKANGAAMRSIPLGYLPTREHVINAAQANAQVSHNDPDAIDSSIGIAIAAYGLRTQQTTRTELANYVSNYLHEEENQHLASLASGFSPEPFFGSEKEVEGVPCHGMKTLGAVIYTLRHANSAKEVLKNANLLGGDTDSVAALALGLYAIQNNISDLPQNLYDDLSNQPFRRDYVLDVAKKLEDKL